MALAWRSLVHEHAPALTAFTGVSRERQVRGPPLRYGVVRTNAPDLQNSMGHYVMHSLRKK
jgi:hypothetical protein